ncbi:MAG: hypothetical protein D6806_06240, partial [Deltaproteobacteria bacterium]
MRKTIPLVILSLLASTPCLARGRGTHFLVEPYTGLSFNLGYSQENALGLESGAVVAVGGKFKGFPPRFYLIARGFQTFFGEDDIWLESRRATASVIRRMYGITGGLRVVIPLWWYVRLNLELTAGELFTSNEYRETGYRLHYDENLAVMEFGGGLNVRLFRWLSAGLTMDYIFIVE